MVEAWLPGQKRYREVTSNTNLTDFQSRRGAIRFMGEGNRRVFPHTISATGFCDRHIIAVMENFQTADGKIVFAPWLVTGPKNVRRPFES